MTDADAYTPCPVAGPVRRLAAMLYDGLLLFGVLFAATIPAVFIGEQLRSVANDAVIHELAPAAGGWVYQLYLLGIVIGFYTWFWRKNGQTLGMQAWRLRVERRDGSRLSPGQCLLRLLGASVSLACLGAGYWWCWLDREGLTWHDRLSRTRVVVYPKR